MVLPVLHLCRDTANGRAAGEASAAVAALISMISPLPYSADFRPYFTIHDEDFGALAGGQLPDNSNALPRLLGVTNLYFLKVADCNASGIIVCPHTDHVGLSASHCLDQRLSPVSMGGGLQPDRVKAHATRRRCRGGRTSCQQASGRR
jgi:hypothetical protein